MSSTALARGAAALALLACTVAAKYIGNEVMFEWTFRGLTPGARSMGDTWPLAFWLVLGLGAVGSLTIGWRQPVGEAKTPAWLGALGAFALCTAGWLQSVLSAFTLPVFASAEHLGAGPALIPLYVGLALLSCAIGVWPRLALAERGLLLFALWSACNGKLFGLDPVSGFAALQLGALVVCVLLAGGASFAELWSRLRSRLGLGLLVVVVALPVWWLVAALVAGRPSSLHVVWRLWAAALVALVALGRAWPDPRATGRRLVLALGWGMVLVALAGVVGVFEAARVEPWSTVLASRLRLLGLHPNLGAALFAAALPLGLGLGLGRTGEGQPRASIQSRVLGLGLVLAAVLVLHLSGSRASMLGAAAGAGLWALVAWTPLASKLGVRSLSAIFVLGAFAVLLFVSPLGEGLRATLDAKADTQSALGQRWHIWRMAGAAIADHPAFGLGPGWFSGHAAYAQPSYYDGTSQVLHTHNIFLAAAEGAGYIGLALFCGLMVALFEVLRRAVLAVPREGAALLGAVVSLLVCNQLDLGQSQLSVVPVLFWLALVAGGLWSCQAAESAEPTAAPADAARQGPGSGLAALALLAVTTWPTLSGTVLVQEAGRAFSLNQDKRAVNLLKSGYGWRYLLNENLIGARLASWAQREGREVEALALAELSLEHDPDGPGSKRRYARALIHAGHYDKGVQAARAALAADPYGESAHAMRVLTAWGLLGAGNREAGIATLASAAVEGGNVPQKLLREFGGPEFTGAMLGELHALGAEIVEQARTEEVTARRRLAGLADAFRDFGSAAAAVQYIEGVIEASPNPIRATYYQLIVLLRSLGRDGDAREVWKASPFADEVNFVEVFAGLDAAADAEASGTGEELDLFFTAGRLVARHMARARELARAGDAAGAERALEQALYNGRDDGARVLLVSEFMDFGLESKEQRMWQVERYLERASVVRKYAREQGLMRRVLLRCVPPFESLDELLQALEGSTQGRGPLSRTLDEVVEAYRGGEAGS